MSELILISVIDDDESVRDSTRNLLRSVGYDVITFESGEVFLESGRLAYTECLILDMRMPGMDGLELQRRLHISETRVPIIFVTGQQDRTRRQLAIDSGASNFFQKPFAASDFLKAVEAAVKNHSGLEGRRP